MIDRADQLIVLEKVANMILVDPLVPKRQEKAKKLAQLIDMHLTRDGYRLAKVADR